MRLKVPVSAAPSRVGLGLSTVPEPSRLKLASASLAYPLESQEQADQVQTCTSTGREQPRPSQGTSSRAQVGFQKGASAAQARRKTGHKMLVMGGPASPRFGAMSEDARPERKSSDSAFADYFSLWPSPQQESVSWKGLIG